MTARDQRFGFRLAIAKMLLAGRIRDNSIIRPICKSLGIWLGYPWYGGEAQEKYVAKLLAYAKTLPEYEAMKL